MRSTLLVAAGSDPGSEGAHEGGVLGALEPDAAGATRPQRVLGQVHQTGACAAQQEHLPVLRSAMLLCETIACAAASLNTCSKKNTRE